MWFVVVCGSLWWFVVVCGGLWCLVPPSQVSILRTNGPLVFVQFLYSWEKRFSYETTLHIEGNVQQVAAIIIERHITISPR